VTPPPKTGPIENGGDRASLELEPVAELSIVKKIGTMLSIFYRLLSSFIQKSEKSDVF
jgi:hypothetical protein